MVGHLGENGLVLGDDFREGNVPLRARILSFWVFWDTYKEIVKRGAEVYLPVFEASGYKHGFISGQLDPQIRHDVDPMVVQAEELHSLPPNVTIKLPGTACP